VKSIGKPDARNGPVRFDERGRETGRRFTVSTRARPRLYTSLTMFGRSMNCFPISRRINKWGVLGIILCAAIYALPARYPFCLVVLLLLMSALSCSIVASVRGSRSWLILSVITGVMTVQAVIALLVEC
jgi:hypothetical protein